MTALSKFLVLLALFLLASHANAFTSLSPVAESQDQENHLIWFEESMSTARNEPSSKLTLKLKGINTSYTFEAVNGVNADASQPTVAKTSKGDKTSYTFEAVNGVNADTS